MKHGGPGGHGERKKDRISQGKSPHSHSSIAKSRRSGLDCMRADHFMHPKHGSYDDGISLDASEWMSGIVGAW